MNYVLRDLLRLNATVYYNLLPERLGGDGVDRSDELSSYVRSGLKHCAASEVYTVTY